MFASTCRGIIHIIFVFLLSHPSHLLSDTQTHNNKVSVTEKKKHQLGVDPHTPSSADTKCPAQLLACRGSLPPSRHSS
ncbi:hypothetical protein V8C40DRAFT_232437 [Trichoderma camerunense]